MQKIIITLTSADGTVTRQALIKPEGKPVQVNVPAGVKLDVQVHGPVQGKQDAQPKTGKGDLQLKQVGKNLVVEGDGEALVEIADFYAMPNTAVGAVSWDYAEPLVNTAASTTIEGQAAGQAAASSEDLMHGESSVGLSMPVVFGVGAVGVAALASGSGGAAVPPANVVSGSFVAGPAVAGNNLVVKLYKTDGTALLVNGVQAQGSVDANGKFSINVGSYTGAILVQLVGAGGGADYRDEATGLEIDLATDLLAMGTVGAGATTINVNPLTAMAAKVAGVTSANGQMGGAYNATKAATANTDVAKAFGLTGDVTKLDSAPVIKADGTVNAAASDLGKVLAALSGLDVQNGGMEQTINAYVSNGVLSSSATIKSDLVAGAGVAQAALAAKGVASLVKDVSAVIAASASTSGYGIDPIANDDVIDGNDTLTAGVTTIAFKVPVGKTAADVEMWMPGASAKAAGVLTVVNGVGVYTLDASDIAALTASDGVKAVQIKAAGAAGSLAERMVLINRVDDAPTKVSLVNVISSLDELTGATTADIKVADIVVSDDGLGSNKLGLAGADASYFTIVGNALYINASKGLNFEVKSTYEVAVTATGGTTSATRQSATQTIRLKDVNEAPTAVGAIAAQTAVKGQSAWSLKLANYFTDVDAGDALTYTLTSGALPAGLTLTDGVIGGTPTAEAASGSFTVTATDKGGLKTTQTFTLAVVAAPVVQSFSVVDATGVTTKGKGGESATFEVAFSEPVTFDAAFTASFKVGNQTISGTSTQTSGGANGLSKVSFTIVLPTSGDGAFTLTAFGGGGTTLGKVSGQPVQAYSGSLAYGDYIVDNTAPTVTSTTFSVDENATAFKTSGALAANETVTWALGTGDDTALFSLTNGVLSLKAAKNYEASADNSAAGTHAYKVNVVATDTAGNATTQAITVNLNDVNEAPTVANAIADKVFVVGGAVDTYIIPANTFADVDANTTLTYSAKLADGSALPNWLTFDAATRTFSGNPPADGTVTVRVTASDGALTVFDDFVLTSVTAPVVQSFSVTDGTVSNGSTLGKFDEALTFVVKLSEAVTTTAGLTAVFTVNGTEVTATATAVTGSDTVTFTGAKVPSTGSGTAISLKSLVADSGAIQGDVSKQPMVAVSAGAIAYAAYTVDNTAPTVTGTTFSVDENATAFKTSGALAANETVTWALGTGDDTALFSLTNGVLSLKAAKNYEASADNSAAGTHAYKVNVVATDTAGNATTQAITVNLNDVNEPVSIVGLSASDAPQAVVVGKSSALNDFTLSDQDASNVYNVTLNAAGGSLGGLTDADANAAGIQLSGSLSDINAALAGATFTASAVGAANVAITVSDGVNTISGTHYLNGVNLPSLVSNQALDGLAGPTALDVRSALVLAFNQNITLGSGHIKVMDDMNAAGWTHKNSQTGETIQDTSNNDVDITLANGVVTSVLIGGVDFTSRFDLTNSVVTNGSNLVIDLKQKNASGPGYTSGVTSLTATTTDLAHTSFDWDFGSNYHVEFDAGIVKSQADSSLINSALTDSTTLNFTTVTPSDNVLGASSKMMDANGIKSDLSEGMLWVNGNQNDQTTSAKAVNMGIGQVAVVIDVNGGVTRSGNLSGWVQLNNFSADDLLYCDNHGVMSMVTTDGLSSGNPAAYNGGYQRTITDNGSVGGNSLVDFYTDVGATIIATSTGDAGIEAASKWGTAHNLVIFG